MLSRMPVPALGSGARLSLIRQGQAAECGLACLAMIATYHGHKIDMDALRRYYAVSLKGLRLKDLVAAADRLGLAARPLRLELDALGHLKTPCILHWNLDHFVVLKRVRGKYVTILDPAAGERELHLSDVSKHFTGIAVEFTPTSAFTPQDERTPFGFSSLWSRITGIWSSLGHVIFLSLIVQICALAVPFFVQVAVDDLLTTSDRNILLVLTSGFTLIVLIQCAASAARSYLAVWLGNSVHFQLTANLVRHLLRLPIAWFQVRQIGDVMSRLTSVQPLRDFITQGMSTALLDGLLTFVTLLVMAAFSPALALIAFAVAVLHFTVRTMSYAALRRHSEDEIAARAEEQTTLIQMVRAIQPIKLFGREATFHSAWQNRYSAIMTANINAGRLRIVSETSSLFLRNACLIAIVSLGALQVMNQTMTIGVFMAFLAYAYSFIDKVFTLIDQIIDYRLFGAHLDRLAGIALAVPEEEPHRAARSLACPKGKIELENVSFRYGDGEPWILRDVSLTINPGDMIALTGPSGAGKTTLLKILLGILRPTSGELRIDGIPLSSLSLSTYRAHIGAVMQDDDLVSGSIAEAISFYDPEARQDWVEECARRAAIHDEIAAMPMGYTTLIGDMGMVLSGGQRQRVLLARALYRQPTWLFLDEGTANLDHVTEARVLETLAGLPLTRVCVAHREAMIKRADRIFIVANAAVREAPPAANGPGADGDETGREPRAAGGIGRSRSSNSSDGSRTAAVLDVPA